MGLLAANLAAIDELRLPPYLESSNRANDRRYERLGFVGIGEFAASGDGRKVGCMWRDSREVWRWQLLRLSRNSETRARTGGELAIELSP
jgi:hypothetical protein